MRFLVFSRKLAECKDTVDANCTIPHIWISFRDPDLQPAKLPDHSLRKDTLFLAIDDVNGDEHGNQLGNPEHDTRSWIAMQPDHAKHIIDFVNQWKDKVDLICVNCGQAFLVQPDVLLPCLFGLTNMIAVLHLLTGTTQMLILSH